MSSQEPTAIGLKKITAGVLHDKYVESVFALHGRENDV